MIKEKVSYVAADPKKEEKDWAASSGKMGGESRVVEYALPDGNKIKVCPPLSYKILHMLIPSRSAKKDSAPQKSSSTPRSSASNTLAFIKSSSMPSTAPI